jgi:hypothetical protein
LSEARSRNHFCRGRAVSIIYFSVCVCVRVRVQALACACARVGLIIQHVTRHHIVICGLSGSTTFSTLSHSWHYFREKNVIGRQTCSLIFSTTSVSNTSHSKNTSARYYHKCRNVFIQSTRY